MMNQYVLIGTAVIDRRADYIILSARLTSLGKDFCSIKHKVPIVIKTLEQLVLYCVDVKTLSGLFIRLIYFYHEAQ